MSAERGQREEPCARKVCFRREGDGNGRWGESRVENVHEQRCGRWVESLDFLVDGTDVSPSGNIPRSLANYSLPGKICEVRLVLEGPDSV